MKINFKAKILFYSACLLFSIVVFAFFIFKSSPYRCLRPYFLFGKTVIPEGTSTKIISGRTTILISGTEETASFYIDQIPVTVRDYRNCTISQTCIMHHYRDSYAKYWSNFIYRDFPVVFINWDEAREYCSAQGGDLPTEAQWNLAAGTNSRKYAWGNEEPSIERVNADGLYQGLIPAGWLPKGASPEGVLDLNGNIREWILDANPDNPLEKGLKGGGFQDAYRNIENESIYYHEEYSPGFNRGFRCVYPAE